MNPQVVPSLCHHRVFGLTPIAVMLSAFWLIFILATPLVQGQEPKESKIVIVSPTTAAGKLIAIGGAVKITYQVNDATINRVTFKISTTREGASGSVVFKKQGSNVFIAKLFKGENTIQLFGFNGSEAVDKAVADLVICNEDCPASEKGEVGKKPGEDSAVHNVAILKREGVEPNTDAKSVKRTIVVQKKANVGALRVEVINGEKTIDYQLIKKSDDETDTIGIINVEVKVAKGTNTIRAFSLDHLGEKGFQDSIDVTCKGDKCPDPAEKTAAAEGDGAKPEQKGSVHISTPDNKAKYTDSKAVPLVVSVKQNPADVSKNVQQLYVTVLNKGKPVDQKGLPLALTYPADTSKDGALTNATKIAIGPGTNTVTVFDPKNPDSERDVVVIECQGDCVGATETAKLTIAVSAVKDGPTYRVKDLSSVDSLVTVPKGGIKKVQYDVISPGKPIFRSDEIEIGDASAKAVDVPVRLKFLKGLNTIRIYDAADPGGENDTSIVIECTGDNCATDFLIATIPTNSRFTRAIVGMEQAGASSAESKTNPFLDFFFTTPLFFRIENGWVPDLDANGVQKREADGTLKVKWGVVQGLDHKPIKIPTFGAWGQVRFSTTPEQVSAFAVFPSNFVNQISDPTKVVNLVQSFDFLAGAEYRAFNSNGWIWTLIPGVKQRTSFYFTFGGGAISPVSVRRESAQLFIVPPDAVPATGTNPAKPVDPRRAEFIRRFGDPKTLTYVGFAPLERDRFFRQYYFGIRLKTHYCEDEDCHRFVNRFPSIVDLGFGQNEAVTGGKWRYDVRDSANNIIGQKRAWVMRLDAFFPLPFKEANFLYLYGTALMKIGGGGVKIQNPLFLDTPTSTIQITDVNVYIPPPDLQPTRMDRDYYKIGIGVNLTDLFNRNKPKP